MNLSVDWRRLTEKAVRVWNYAKGTVRILLSEGRNANNSDCSLKPLI